MYTVIEIVAMHVCANINTDVHDMYRMVLTHFTLNSVGQTTTMSATIMHLTGAILCSVYVAVYVEKW